MNLLIIILCVYIIWRLHKQRRPRPCQYQRHEMNHAQTLTQIGRKQTHADIKLMEKELIERIMLVWGKVDTLTNDVNGKGVVFNAQLGELRRELNDRDS